MRKKEIQRYQKDLARILGRMHTAFDSLEVEFSELAVLAEVLLQLLQERDDRLMNAVPL